MTSMLNTVAWYLSESSMASRLFMILLVVFMLTIVVALIAIGVTVTTASLNDTPILLESGWRVLQGQRASIDYYSPLGPMMSLFIAWGMLIAGPSAKALVSANIIVFIVVSLYAWALGRSRMPPFLSFLFAVFSGLMITGTNIYATHFTGLGYAALYNRYGAAFLGLVLVESIIRTRENESKLELTWGVATGIICAILFFLKINFWGIALVGVILGSLLVGRSRLGWIGLGLGALSAILLMFAYMQFSFSGIFADLIMVIRVKSASAFEWGKIMQAVWGVDVLISSLLFLLMAISGKCVSLHGSRAFKNFSIPSEKLLLLFFILGHIFLFLTNSQGNAPILLSIGVFIFAAHHFRNCLPVSRGSSLCLYFQGLHKQTVFMAIIFVIGSTMFSNVLSIGYSAYFRFWNKEAIASERFDSKSLEDLHVLARDRDHLHYIKKINEGIVGLRAIGNQQDKVLTFDFSNPFPLALLWNSPTGDALWWHKGITFTDDVYPAVEKVLEGASIVMIPTDPVDKASRESVLRIYLGKMEESGGVLATSEFWIAVVPDNAREEMPGFKLRDIDGEPYLELYWRK